MNPIVECTDEWIMHRVSLKAEVARLRVAQDDRSWSTCLFFLSIIQDTQMELPHSKKSMRSHLILFTVIVIVN